jgi:Family of unknown function (DUF6152)
MTRRYPLCTTLTALVSWSAWAYSEQTTPRPASAASASLAEHFDTTKPITVSGVVHGLAWETKSPYVFIAIGVDDKGTGMREVRWALKGDTREALERAGWKFSPTPDGTLQLGEAVSATGYPAKPNIDLAAAIPGAPPEMMQVAKAGGLVHGLQVTRLKDDKTFYFGPRK